MASKSKNIAHRNRVQKIVGPAYAKHAWAFTIGKCIYCGEPPTEIDHVPSMIWVYSLGAGHFHDKGYPIVTVPACKRCNNWLSSKPYHTIRQRKSFVASKLRELLDEIMRSPIWHDDQIEEMGHTFQPELTARENVRRYGLRRLEWAESTLPWDLAGD